MTAPAVAVVIVTYNSASTIEGCLTALSEALAALAVPTETIVWDNASSDDTVAIVRAHPLAATPGFHLTASTQNLGFGGGNNAAAAIATAPLLLLLNPDAFLDDPQSIVRLRTEMIAQGGQVAGPFLANADGSHQVGDAGHAETLGVAACWATGLNLLPGVRGSFLSRSCSPETPPFAIDWVCGACLMIARTLFEILGGFDTRIFLYSEDVDLCLRAGSVGAGVVYVPAVRVRHIQGVSLNDRISTTWLDSRFALFERTHPSALKLWLFARILQFGFGWRWLAYAALERVSPMRRKRAMAARMHAYLRFAGARGRPADAGGHRKDPIR